MIPGQKTKWKKRASQVGFLKRMKTAGGRSVLARRRLKGRKVLADQQKHAA
jgi:ribosomal protein L34